MRKKRTVSLTEIITVIIVSIVFITLTIAMFSCITALKDTMESNAVTSGQQIASQVSNMVENYTKDMVSIMEELQENYKKNKGVHYINSVLDVRKDIVTIRRYDKEKNLQQCWTRGYSLKDHIYGAKTYESRYLSNSSNISLSEPHVESLLVNSYPWVVSITKKLETSEGEDVWIELNVKFSEIAAYLDKVGIGQHGYCYIMDEEGTIVYHPQQQLINAGIKMEDTKILVDKPDGVQSYENAIYTIQTLSSCRWRIVGVCYVNEMIAKKFGGVIRFLVMIAVVVILTVIISSIILSRYISRPIKKLILAMREFETHGEAFTYETISGTAEITSLSDSFAHMVVRIKELMEKVRKEEITLRKTELNALQAQINPHFLYNTLDAIGWLCEQEATQDAVKMTNALAKLFRISISKGHEMIPIAKEVEHAKSYLQIEKFRYKNQFEYTFDVEEACLPYYCNKITLQPIIENAITHGLDRMVDVGEINISIKEDGEDILFTVTDNGIGMTKEQCESILNHERSGQYGIGIKNVNDRVRIYFGDTYGVSIMSELDEGTSVSIRMPKVLEGSHETK